MLQEPVDQLNIRAAPLDPVTIAVETTCYPKALSRRHLIAAHVYDPVRVQAAGYQEARASRRPRAG